MKVLGDSHIADFEYHEIPQVVKVITSVVLGLSRVAALWKMKFIVPQILKLRCFFEEFYGNNLQKK